MWGAKAKLSPFLSEAKLRRSSGNRERKLRLPPRKGASFACAVHIESTPDVFTESSHSTPRRPIRSIDPGAVWLYPVVHSMTLSMYACRLACASGMRQKVGVRDESVI